MLQSIVLFHFCSILTSVDCIRRKASSDFISFLFVFLLHSLFERAVSTAGEEFRADKLWDAYIEWEKSQGQLQRVTALYDRVFKVPTQNYSQHFEK